MAKNVIWTTERLAALAEGRRRLAAELAAEEALAARRQACRELVGCACEPAKQHKVGCILSRRHRKARKPTEWTQEARQAAAARLRARWEALEPSERSRLASHAAKSKRRRWSWERRRAHSLRMRQIWREWRSGIRPTSARQVRFLREMGMWPMR